MAKVAAPEKVGLSDLKALVAEDTGLSAAEVGKVFTSLKEVVPQCIAEGLKVDLLQLATIEFKYAPAKPKRPGRNPSTGEEVMLKAKPESLGVKAKPGALVKKAVPTLRSKAGKEVGAYFQSVAEQREKAKRKREREAAAEERAAASAPARKAGGKKKATVKKTAGKKKARR